MRPVVVIQADALTEADLATLLVVPLTSQRRRGAEALRVPISAPEGSPVPSPGPTPLGELPRSALARRHRP